MTYVFAGGAHTPSVIVDPATLKLNEVPADQQQLLTGNKIFVTADNPAELNAFLARISLLCNKPIDELRISDISRVCAADSLEFDQVTLDGRIYTVIHVSDTQEDLTQEFNQEEYFLGEIPKFTPGTGVYLNSSFDTEWTGLRKDIALAGLSGAAQALYKGNYETATNLPPVNIPADSPVGKLLTFMFSPSTSFNQGHLNVLKMMGLVDGSATADPSTWTVTPNKGALIVAAIGTDRPKFIPSMNLLQMPQDLQTMAAGVSKYFTAAGYAAGYSAEDVEKVAADVLNKGMGADKTPLPANLVIPQDTAGKLLNHLFKLAPGNQQFTVAQINTAVAMGLITFDGSANPPTLAMTEIGNTYLKGKEAPPTAAPTPAPAPAAPPPAPTDNGEAPGEDEEEDDWYWYGNS